VVDPGAREKKNVSRAKLADGVKLAAGHYYLLVLGRGGGGKAPSKKTAAGAAPAKPGRQKAKAARKRPTPSVGDLEIECPLDKGSPAARHSRYILTADDGSSRSELGVADHAKPSGDGWVLTFKGLTKGKKYSLLLDGGDGGEHYYVLRGYTFGKEEA
jgi:hypothetical protein